MVCSLSWMAARHYEVKRAKKYGIAPRDLGIPMLAGRCCSRKDFKPEKMAQRKQPKSLVVAMTQPDGDKQDSVLVPSNNVPSYPVSPHTFIADEPFPTGQRKGAVAPSSINLPPIKSPQPPLFAN